MTRDEYEIQKAQEQANRRIESMNNTVSAINSAVSLAKTSFDVADKVTSAMAEERAAKMEAEYRTMMQDETYYEDEEGKVLSTADFEKHDEEVRKSLLEKYKMDDPLGRSKMERASRNLQTGYQPTLYAKRQDIAREQGAKVLQEFAQTQVADISSEGYDYTSKLNTADGMPPVTDSVLSVMGDNIGGTLWNTLTEAYVENSGGTMTDEDRANADVAVETARFAQLAMDLNIYTPEQIRGLVAQQQDNLAVAKMGSTMRVLFENEVINGDMPFSQFVSEQMRPMYEGGIIGAATDYSQEQLEGLYTSELQSVSRLYSEWETQQQEIIDGSLMEAIMNREDFNGPLELVTTDWLKGKMEELGLNENYSGSKKLLDEAYRNDSMMGVVEKVEQANANGSTASLSMQEKAILSDILSFGEEHTLRKYAYIFTEDMNPVYEGTGTVIDESGKIAGTGVSSDMAGILAMYSGFTNAAGNDKAAPDGRAAGFLANQLELDMYDWWGMYGDGAREEAIGEVSELLSERLKSDGVEFDLSGLSDSDMASLAVGLSELSGMFEGGKDEVIGIYADMIEGLPKGEDGKPYVPPEEGLGTAGAINAAIIWRLSDSDLPDGIEDIMIGNTSFGSLSKSWITQTVHWGTDGWMFLDDSIAANVEHSGNVAYGILKSMLNDDWATAYEALNSSVGKGLLTQSDYNKLKSYMSRDAKERMEALNLGGIASGIEDSLGKLSVNESLISRAMGTALDEYMGELTSKANITSMDMSIYQKEAQDFIYSRAVDIIDSNTLKTISFDWGKNDIDEAMDSMADAVIGGTVAEPIQSFYDYYVLDDTQNEYWIESLGVGDDSDLHRTSDRDTNTLRENLNLIQTKCGFNSGSKASLEDAKWAALATWMDFLDVDPDFSFNRDNAEAYFSDEKYRKQVKEDVESWFEEGDHSGRLENIVLQLAGIDYGTVSNLMEMRDRGFTGLGADGSTTSLILGGKEIKATVAQDGSIRSTVGDIDLTPLSSGNLSKVADNLHMHIPIVGTANYQKYGTDMFGYLSGLGKLIYIREHEGVYESSGLKAIDDTAAALGLCVVAVDMGGGNLRIGVVEREKADEAMLAGSIEYVTAKSKDKIKDFESAFTGPFDNKKFGDSGYSDPVEYFTSTEEYKELDQWVRENFRGYKPQIGAEYKKVTKDGKPIYVPTVLIVPDNTWGTPQYYGVSRH